MTKTLNDMIAENRETSEQLDVIKDNMKNIFFCMKTIEDYVNQQRDGSTGRILSGLQRFKEAADNFNQSIYARDQQLLDEWRAMDGGFHITHEREIDTVETWIKKLTKPSGGKPTVNSVWHFIQDHFPNKNETFHLKLFRHVTIGRN